MKKESRFKVYNIFFLSRFLNRRSQAALEFLTTYGWAFLVILIMMSALAYFGVLNPSKLLPDRCNFGTEIGCSKDLLVVNNINDNTLSMRLKNSFGAPVVVTAATTVTSDFADAGFCTPEIDNVDITVDVPWNTDEVKTFSADCATGTALIEKEKVKFAIEISYYASSGGTAYTKKIFGEVFTSVQ